MAHKAVRHEHKITEDKFVTRMLLLSEYFQRNWKMVAGIAAGIVVIIIIALSLSSHQKAVAKEAVRQFDNAIAAYQSGDLETAFNEFQHLTSDYSGTKEGSWAYFYLGKILIEQNPPDYEQAEEYFQIAYKEIKEDILKEAAFIGAANCQLAQGNEDKYYDTLEQIVKRFPNSSNAPSLLYEIGEYYWEQERFEKAKSYYQEIVEKYEDASVYSRAKNRLAEIELFG